MANRFSYNIVDQISSVTGDINWEVGVEYNGHISSVQDDELYYLPLKKIYEQFSEDGDTHKMLSNAYNIIDAVIKDITYCYSMADSFESIRRDLNARKCRFLNDGTVKLFDLIRAWASSEAKVHFEEGIDPAIQFMSKSFGIIFTDESQGERFDLLEF